MRFCPLACEIFTFKAVRRRQIEQALFPEGRLQKTLSREKVDGTDKILLEEQVEIQI